MVFSGWGLWERAVIHDITSFCYNNCSLPPIKFLWGTFYYFSYVSGSMSPTYLYQSLQEPSNLTKKKKWANVIISSGSPIYRGKAERLAVDCGLGIDEDSKPRANQGIKARLPKQNLHPHNPEDVWMNHTTIAKLRARPLSC